MESISTHSLAPIVNITIPEDLEQWQAYYRNSDRQADRDLSTALSDFHQFSTKYTGYFEEIIRRQQFDSEKITEEHLIYRYQMALQEYWAPLGRVAEQRQVSHYRKLLDVGTEKAQQYLAKLKDNNRSPKILPGVLIYFDKAPLIKYCPYTNFAFLGVPYSVAVKNDWMAIPHELGHYVYWNLKANLEGLKAEHKRLEGIVTNTIEQLDIESTHLEITQGIFTAWLEEIFAEIVGTWLAGESFIESFMGLLKNLIGHPKELNENDGTHPIPLLRPFIRNRTLELMKGRSLIGRLKDFFQESFKLALDSLPIDIHRPLDEDMLKGKNEQQLKEILLAMFPKSPEEAVVPEQPIFPSAQLSFELIQTTTEAIVEKLYREIDNYLRDGGLPHPQDIESAFTELTSIPGTEGEQPYELLLQPRIVEGKTWHSHGLYALHWGWPVYHGQSGEHGH